MTAKTKTPKPPSLTALDALEQAAECLKTLAHPHRLRMVQMLLQGRYTVGELAEACGIPSHMASEHLRSCSGAGFLTSEKDGRKAYYQIAEPHLANIMACIEARFGGKLSFFRSICRNVVILSTKERPAHQRKARRWNSSFLWASSWPGSSFRCGCCPASESRPE